jgi:hypothetical protein
VFPVIWFDIAGYFSMNPGVIRIPFIEEWDCRQRGVWLLGYQKKNGKQPVNIFGEVFGAVGDEGDAIYSKWSAKVSFTLLFPK